ncbi:MAG: uracil-DNA glycosylase [Zetaproteobacteria bacterium]|nr:MAG: uracil-DNA glycosylase [Zetaproteobacteria bacterium]
MPAVAFDGGCRRCPRLAALLDQVKGDYPDYFCAPVPPFGDPTPRLLIVGLAPGMHGANRTGRPFTGDYAGILLYRTLHRLGVASAPESRSAEDGLRLDGVRITNAVKCLPPKNRPVAAEIRQCNPFLAAEIAGLPASCNLLALGLVAHQAVLRACRLPLASRRFAHGAAHSLPDGRRLIDSYHCSRYNTQTGRLTEEAFRAVVAQALEPPA